MRRSNRTPDGEDLSPSLFDLPLEPARGGRPEPPAASRGPKDKDKERDRDRPPSSTAPRPVSKPAPKPPAASVAEPEDADGGERIAGFKGRFLAGAADLLVHAAVAAAAVAGSSLLGAPPKPSDWPPLALFLLTFSFLYTVLPLAFWGQTLGMAWSGLIARSRDGEALSFDQTARRWLAGLFTAATLGIPLLATGSGRSLSDRLSGSATHLAS